MLSQQLLRSDSYRIFIWPARGWQQRGIGNNILNVFRPKGRVATLVAIYKRLGVCTSHRKFVRPLLLCWFSQQVGYKCMFWAIPQRKKQGENTKCWINVFSEMCDPSQRNPFATKKFSAYQYIWLCLSVSSLVPQPLFFLSSCFSQYNSISVSSPTNFFLLTSTHVPFPGVFLLWLSWQQTHSLYI